MTCPVGTRCVFLSPKTPFVLVKVSSIEEFKGDVYDSLLGSGSVLAAAVGIKDRD